jgi:cytochrome c peroxidase
MTKSVAVFYSITLWLFSAVIAQELTPVEKLGKALFFDKNLSLNKNQSCASCHAPEVGWTGPDEEINKGGGVYEASVVTKFGNRKPPSSAYATPAMNFHMTEQQGEFVGGNFWDGRATGEVLGSPAADQAQGPFLNPLEQAIPNANMLVEKVAASAYAGLFRQAYGADAFADVEKAYGNIGRAIAAYEASAEVNQFSSKFDAWLAGKATLTAEERIGLELFEGKAKCANCHTSKPGPNNTPPLFTDFTYDNLGFPRNPDNPFYKELDVNPAGANWVDEGLGGFLSETSLYKQFARENMGKHKVPTLRNIDKRPRPDYVKAFGHNGYFKSLKAVVHFYNTRDKYPRCTNDRQKPGVDCWPPPEVGLNINKEELGDLKLTEVEENAIVAFLKTLSDGFSIHK